ncbi:hypothetical protein [Brevundimonas sp.]|uniref:hypothetical protein n=1 Tax=Brevundimonas sp. TaxID=1871086 RepID=UPI0019AEA961|nr:hypothetical protein [Brevundimonas sp.]MBD3835342.1 hypothetical protein [Brevundimonas sp.]
MKPLNWLAALPLLAIAPPAWAAADDGGNPAVWIALGAVFIGAFTAIGAAMLAASKKNKPPEKK